MTGFILPFDDRYSITHLCLIPSLVQRLINSPKAKEADLSSLAFVSCGGAYLPDSLATELINMGPKNMEMLEGKIAPYKSLKQLIHVFTFTGYGITEATLPVTTKPFPGILGGRVKSVPGSAGILLPGMQARILREDGTEAGPNEPGELWLKSGSIAMGYWNNEEATREAFVDGWLKTGDRFVIDEDVTLFFQDRIKVRVVLGLVILYLWAYRCALAGYTENLGYASVSYGNREYPSRASAQINSRCIGRRRLERSDIRRKGPSGVGRLK